MSLCSSMTMLDMSWLLFLWREVESRQACVRIEVPLGREDGEYRFVESAPLCGTPIAHEHDSCRKRRRLHQCQVEALSFRIQSLATTQNEGIDVQAVLVNQIILRQRPGQHAAPVDKDVLAGLLFELPYGFNDIVANEGRVPPGRGGFQSGGHHVLADVVHRIAEWVTCHRFKRAAVDLPCLSA